MAQAIFRHGDPIMIDYTPAANAVGGDVLLLGNTTGLTCGVYHRDATNAVLASIAAGGGVYECTSLENNANFAKVWWDDTANKLTSTSTNNALFGFIVRNGGGGANTNVFALHRPYV